MLPLDPATISAGETLAGLVLSPLEIAAVSIGAAVIGGFVFLVAIAIVGLFAGAFDLASKSLKL